MIVLCHNLLRDEEATPESLSEPVIGGIAVAERHVRSSSQVCHSSLLEFGKQEVLFDCHSMMAVTITAKHKMPMNA